jgi:hypothetical protein
MLWNLNISEYSFKFWNISGFRFLNFIYLFDSTGFWTKGFTLVKQVLYYLSHAPSRGFRVLD